LNVAVLREFQRTVRHASDLANRHASAQDVDNEHGHEQAHRRQLSLGCIVLTETESFERRRGKSAVRTFLRCEIVEEPDNAT
jgi:hypothetical protein